MLAKPDNSIIYVVSGTSRSGTSMMMQALIAGGMEAIYDKDISVLLSKRVRQGIPFNKNGIFEISQKNSLYNLK